MAAVPTSNSSVPVPLELSDGTSARPPSLAENGVAWAWALMSIDMAVPNTTDTSVWRRMTSPFVTVEIAICLNRPRKRGPPREQDTRPLEGCKRPQGPVHRRRRPTSGKTLFIEAPKAAEQKHCAAETHDHEPSEGAEGDQQPLPFKGRVATQTRET